MIYILLPAYNEQEGIEKLLLRIKRVFKIIELPHEIVIVNDGSTDHTAQVIKSYKDDLPIDIINFKKNSGVKTVFNEGFKLILKKSNSDNDILITLDSDNTQNPFYIYDIVNEININHYDLVIASRFKKPGNMVGVGFFRKVLSVGASKLFKIRFGVGGVSDYSIFFRGYRLGLLRKAYTKYGDNLLEGAGFSCIANLLIKINTLNPNIVEIPFILRYDLKEGGSGLHIFRTIWGYLKFLFK